MKVKHTYLFGKSPFRKYLMSRTYISLTNPCSIPCWMNLWEIVSVFKRLLDLIDHTWNCCKLLARHPHRLETWNYQAVWRVTQLYKSLTYISILKESIERIFDVPHIHISNKSLWHSLLKESPRNGKSVFKSSVDLIDHTWNWCKLLARHPHRLETWNYQSVLQVMQLYKSLTYISIL